MKKVLISGANGQLMLDVKDALNKYEDIFSVKGYSGRDMWDVTDSEESERRFQIHEPDIYIHGASYHVVDQIEKDPVKALDVNVASLHRIAKLCNDYNTMLINFSTDYVFSGNDVGPKNPGELSTLTSLSVPTMIARMESTGPKVNFAKGYPENWTPDPVNFYGLTKYAGEKAVSNSAELYLNIRVCGLFGNRGSKSKGCVNFPLLVLDKLDANEQMKVVNDQYTTIGYTRDIAENLVNQLRTIGENGDYFYKSTIHLMNEGILTWYELALFIAQIKGKEHLITPVSSDENYSDVKRAKYTALKNSYTKLPPWQSAIVRYLQEIRRL